MHGTSPAYAASDDSLFERQRLPDAWRYLEAELPRKLWPETRLHVTARRWLQIHQGFRTAHQELLATSADWAEGRFDVLRFRRTILPQLASFLSHLDSHHRIETEHYFPVFAAAEPRMKGGFELLDRDHDAIHGLLIGMSDAGYALHILAPDDPDLPRRRADELVTAIAAATVPLQRHLLDEEDVIVPQMTLRGDPFERA